MNLNFIHNMTIVRQNLLNTPLFERPVDNNGDKTTMLTHQSPATNFAGVEVYSYRLLINVYTNSFTYSCRASASSYSSPLPY